jgi:hypothetical protein
MSDAPVPRYERKFVVAGVGVDAVRWEVIRHKAMFAEAYPPRRVNNIYLDTPLRRDYADNLRGVGDRAKTRIRWYGDLFGPVETPRLEFKIKSGLVGWKETYSLPGFAFTAPFDARGFGRWVKGAGLPAEARARLLGAEPSLVNSYRRSYFATCGNDFRVTIDDDLAYYRVHRLTNRFLARRCDRRNVIVELKYSRDLEMEAHRVASAFLFRIGKSSKYAMGLEAVEPYFG